MGIAAVKREVLGRQQHLEGSWQFEEFCFHAEESAQHPGKEICVE
jgi:hypothetical protein